MKSEKITAQGLEKLKSHRPQSKPKIFISRGEYNRCSDEVKDIIDNRDDCVIIGDIPPVDPDADDEIENFVADRFSKLKGKKITKRGDND